jgi:ferredoxin-NAD(P)+ reductase (naphthalene dioxygenase ferredoxin-specific)
MEVVVQPLGRTLSVQPGTNLLDCLREHNVPISYSCTAGRCGTCRCKVIEGAVHETGRDNKLTQPQDDGYVLACMSVISGNCTVEVPEPDEVVIHPARILKASVASIESMTHDILRIRMRSAKPLEFSPGQYATLQFTPEHIRPYSMAGLPHDDELEFHVRLVAGGRVTGYVANTLKVGDAVRVSGPLGTAYLRRKHEGPMLCVAGGTGLAPVLSIVRGALAAGMANPIHLYFGVRSERDIYGAQWLDELARQHPQLRVQIVIGNGEVGAGHRRGLVTDAIHEDWRELAGWRAYLCGAPPMVDAASMLIKKKGVLTEHIYADAFYPSGI